MKSSRSLVFAIQQIAIFFAFLGSTFAFAQTLNSFQSPLSDGSTAVAAAMSDGKWLVTGGKSGLGQILSSAYVLDTKTGNRTPVDGGMREARYGHTLTPLPGGKLLVVGGFTNGLAAASQTVEIYDPKTDRFEVLGSLKPTARAFHNAVVLLDGRVLLANGVSMPDQMVNQIEIIDAKLQTMSLMASLNGQPRLGATVTVQNASTVRFIGGYLASGQSIGTDSVINVKDGSVVASAFSESTDVLRQRSLRGGFFVTDTFPLNSQLNVSPDTAVGVLFSRLVSAASILPAHVKLQDERGNAIALTFAWGDNQHVLMVKPLAVLDSLTKYKLSFRGLTSSAGDQLSEQTIEFTTSGRNIGTSSVRPSDRFGNGYVSSLSEEERKGVQQSGKPILKVDGKTLPLYFEKNVGQQAAGTDYLAYGKNYRVNINATNLVLRLTRTKALRDAAAELEKFTGDEAQKKILRRQYAQQLKSSGAEPFSLRIETLNGNAQSQATAIDVTSFKTHYFLGPSQQAWKSNIPNYQRLNYKNVYPGIDKSVYGNLGSLEYDWVLQPGADSTQIVQKVHTKSQITINTDGDLVILVDDEEIRQKRPVAYQIVNGQKNEVKVAYLVNTRNEVRYQLGPYDKSQTLVIDPLLYSGTAPLVNLPGSIQKIVSSNDDKPILLGTSVVYQSSGPPQNVSFIAQVNASSGAYDFLTYLGQKVNDIAVDPVSGDIWAVGVGIESSIPKIGQSPPPSGASLCSNCSATFALRLKSDGSQITYSGVQIYDSAPLSVAVTNAQEVLISGSSYTSKLPVELAPAVPLTGLHTIYSIPRGFVLKLNPVAGGQTVVTSSGYSVAANASQAQAFRRFDLTSLATPNCNVLDAWPTKTCVGSSGNSTEIAYPEGVAAAKVLVLSPGKIAVQLVYKSDVEVAPAFGFSYVKTTFRSQLATLSTGDFSLLGYTTVDTDEESGPQTQYRSIYPPPDLSTNGDGIVYSVRFDETDGYDVNDSNTLLVKYAPQDWSLPDILPTQQVRLNSPGQQMMMAVDPSGSINFAGGRVDLSKVCNYGCIYLERYSSTLQRITSITLDLTNYWAPTSLGMSRTGAGLFLGVRGGIGFQDGSSYLSLFQDTDVVGGRAVSTQLTISPVGSTDPVTGLTATISLSVPSGAIHNGYVSLTRYSRSSTTDGVEVARIYVNGAGSTFSAPVYLNQGSTFGLPVGEHAFVALYIDTSAQPPGPTNNWPQAGTSSRVNYMVFAAAKVSLTLPIGQVQQGTVFDFTLEVDGPLSSLCGQSSFDVISPNNLLLPAPGQNYICPASACSASGSRLSAQCRASLSNLGEAALVGSYVFSDNRTIQSLPRTINVIASAPALSFVLPEALNTAQAATRGLVVEGQQNANSSVAVKVELFATNAVGTRGLLETFVNPPFKYLWYPNASGTYTLELRSYDSFGQIASATRVVTVSVTSSATDVITADGVNLGKGVITFFHQDLRGNNIAATDVAGVVLWKEAYSPFGERIITPATGGKGGQWFQGKLQDTDTGLNYFGARYYDPTIGRFYATDPQAFNEGSHHSFNRYAYANNNPLRYTDPDGHTPVDIAFLAYDVFNLGKAVYQGAGVGAAAVDVGLSLLGVISPVPATGQLLKAGRAASRAADVVRETAHAADGAKGLLKAESAAVKATPHKNSLEYVGDTHVYAIRDGKGVTHKVGESAQGVRKGDGASIRAESQVRGLRREEGERYTSEIRKSFPDKASAREYETRMIEKYRGIYGKDTLPGNLTNR